MRRAAARPRGGPPPAPGPVPRPELPVTWSFPTNHARVLACLAADPAARMRAAAGRVGITERAVQRIVAELSAGGYLTITRSGRENR